MIFIMNYELLDEECGGKEFGELTDKEIIELYEKYGRSKFDVFEDAQEMSASWNTEEIMYPSHSYMRVIYQPNLCLKVRKYR